MNNYDFPSAEANDSFIGEKWFIRDDLNLSAEALAQLAALQTGRRLCRRPSPAGTRASIMPPSACDLLFVGITRTRKALTITWNTGRGAATEATPLIGSAHLVGRRAG